MATENSFGRLVKNRRRILDLTQQELASQVGYSVITIRKVEADDRRPSRQLVERLARSLNIEPAQRDAFMTLARLDQALPSGLGAERMWDTGHRPPTNLASPLTRLIGRDHEVAQLRAMLQSLEIRLVTLVGPPGIGKSRLSVQVATELRHLYPDGIFWVSLAPINDPMLVAQTIASTCGVKDSSAMPLTAALIDHLRGRRLLLLLDDFEHMLAAAPLVADLLTACPELTVLATSRAQLRIRGERLFYVPPLALPDPGRDVTAAAVARFAAVELFVERAQAVASTFALSDANAVDIAEICGGLDGLPLAIELVAARARLLTPQAIKVRLNDRLSLLTDGPRDLPERQQTLRRTIDWSYNLLDPAEQVLFARLAIFAGGCSLAAAEEVTDVDGDLSISVLDGLAALADKNLVRQEERADGERYFGFFETIREYALERLLARDEEQAIRARHAGHYLALAETASRHLVGERQEAWLLRLDAEHNNLRAVLEWHIQRGAAEAALRLAAALWKFWHIHSRQTEGGHSIAQVLALRGSHSERVRAQVLYGGGWIAQDQSDHDTARAYFDESLAIYRSLADQRGIAEALHGVGAMVHSAGASRDATELFSESLALYRTLDDAEGIAWSLDHLGRASLSLTDHTAAEERFSESLAIFGTLRHAWGSAILTDHLGLAALAQADYPRARGLFRDALRRFQELANTWGIATAYDHLGQVALSVGEPEQAERYFTTSLELSQADDDRDGIVRSWAGLAGVAVRGRQLERAAALLGAVEAQSERANVLIDPVEQILYQHDLTVVRANLDRAEIVRAWSSGRSLTISQVTAMALAPAG